MERLISFFGLFVILALVFALSTDKKRVNWKTVISGLILQLVLGVLILKTQIGFKFF